MTTWSTAAPVLFWSRRTFLHGTEPPLKRICLCCYHQRTLLYLTWPFSVAGDGAAAAAPRRADGCRAMIGAGSFTPIIVLVWRASRLPYQWRCWWSPPGRAPSATHSSAYVSDFNVGFRSGSLKCFNKMKSFCSDLVWAGPCDHKSYRDHMTIKGRVKFFPKIKLFFRLGFRLSWYSKA